ncbi:hypothetical protein TI39_contig341g00013 [Zymoseptoria brevis]|uniref:F-box domain-containing protein n=1 Tax=Zymoseptoria brevis TaxID=1047168 RepID=A0A0F4GSX8_9PEZI|nr:hypothetical protein TI39_contig341g00013 [Zymoseptoria brevis]
MKFSMRTILLAALAVTKVAALPVAGQDENAKVRRDDIQAPRANDIVQRAPDELKKAPDGKDDHVKTNDMKDTAPSGIGVARKRKRLLPASSSITQPMAEPETSSRKERKKSAPSEEEVLIPELKGPEQKPGKHSDQPPFRLFDLPDELWVAIGQMAMCDKLGRPSHGLDLRSLFERATGYLAGRIEKNELDYAYPAILHTCKRLRNELLPQYYQSLEQLPSLDPHDGYIAPAFGFWLRAIDPKLRYHLPSCEIEAPVESYFLLRSSGEALWMDFAYHRIGDRQQEFEDAADMCGKYAFTDRVRNKLRVDFEVIERDMDDAWLQEYVDTIVFKHPQLPALIKAPLPHCLQAPLLPARPPKLNETTQRERLTDLSQSSLPDLMAATKLHSDLIRDVASSSSAISTAVSSGTAQPFRLLDLPDELWIKIGKMIIDELPVTDIEMHGLFEDGDSFLNPESFTALKVLAPGVKPPAILQTCSGLRKESSLDYYKSKITVSMEQIPYKKQELVGMYLRSIGADAREQIFGAVAIKRRPNKGKTRIREVRGSRQLSTQKKKEAGDPSESEQKHEEVKQEQEEQEDTKQEEGDQADDQEIAKVDGRSHEGDPHKTNDQDGGAEEDGHRYSSPLPTSTLTLSATGRPTSLLDLPEELRIEIGKMVIDDLPITIIQAIADVSPEYSERCGHIHYQNIDTLSPGPLPPAILQTSSALRRELRPVYFREKIVIENSIRSAAPRLLLLDQYMGLVGR